jgi:hypothetical protein
MDDKEYRIIECNSFVVERMYWKQGILLFFPYVRKYWLEQKTKAHVKKNTCAFLGCALAVLIFPAKLHPNSMSMSTITPSSLIYTVSSISVHSLFPAVCTASSFDLTASFLL